MKNTLIRIALLIGLPTMTYLGFLGGIEGALYVVKFFVWAICLPVGLIALTETAQNDMAQQSPSGGLFRFAWRIVAWSALGVMLWTGHIATACAWGFYILCSATAAEGVKRHRAAAEASTAS